MKTAKFNIRIQAKSTRFVTEKIQTLQVSALASHRGVTTCSNEPLHQTTPADPTMSAGGIR